MAIKFNQVILNKLQKNKTRLSKKIDLSILDEFVYRDNEGMQEEVDKLTYLTEEFFPEKFDQWYDLGREIYSIYFQNGEPLVTEVDLQNDLAVLDKIREAANELGIDVNQVYPDYDSHKQTIEQGFYSLDQFESQKQEFIDESKSV